ncbi:hypothetical protein Tco_1371076 [Tanacetum coccineum]|uniref:Uncharacterized protein n=1 Tax=Tanacetum coccineum TaxID=301880 RepID=A0ABQ4Y6D5_9ASTR
MPDPLSIVLKTISAANTLSRSMQQQQNDTLHLSYTGPIAIPNSFEVVMEIGIGEYGEKVSVEVCEDHRRA